MILFKILHDIWSWKYSISLPYMQLIQYMQLSFFSTMTNLSLKSVNAMDAPFFIIIHSSTFAIQTHVIHNYLYLNHAGFMSTENPEVITFSGEYSSYRLAVFSY